MNQGFENMNIKITPYISNNMFTIKHPIYEIVDINSPTQKNKFRTFSDATTSAFVNSYIEDIDVRHKFIDYTYSLVYSNLQILINRLLVNENFEPLHDKEAVYFYFKGGNIMYELTKGKLMIKDVSTIDNIKNNNKVYENIINSMTNQDIIDDVNKVFKSNLKISDVDYSVIIIAHDYQRFLIIKQFVLRILSYTLEEISLFFDKLYDGTYEDDNTEKLPSVKLDNMKYNYLNNILKNVKINKDYNFPEDYDEIAFYDINNIYILTTLYNIMYTKYGLTAENNLNRIANKIIKLIEYKKAALVNANFYTLEKNRKYIENIVEEYKEIKQQNHIYYKMADVDNYNQYILSNIPNTYDLSVEKRADFVMKCNNDIHNFYEKVNLNAEMKYHYITFNDIIYTMNQQGQQIVNFSLMRIKFNTVINNCIHLKTNDDRTFKLVPVKIPSEFIDISVSDFDINYVHEMLDYNESHLNFVTLNRPNTNENEQVQIWSYNFKQVFDDLSNTLFVQKIYMPWLDQKYNKRIIRMLIFSYFDLKDQKFIFKELLNFSSIAYLTLNNKNMSFPYYDVKLMLGLPSYDNNSIDILLKSVILKNLNMINIGNNLTYNYFKDMINVIIVYMFLLNSNKITDIEYSNFVDNINKENSISKTTNISAYREETRTYIVNMLITIIKYGEPLYESFTILQDPVDSDGIIATPQQGGNYNSKSINDLKFVPRIIHNNNISTLIPVNKNIKCKGIKCTYHDIIDIDD